MPRLRNRAGVVVNVSEETAAALGAEWQSVEGKAEKPAPKSTPKSSKSSK